MRPRPREVRRATPADRSAVWALNDLPNIGHTADDNAPLDLPPARHPPATFRDLAEIPGSFVTPGGDFLVAVEGEHLVAMGGIRPTPIHTASIALGAEVCRVRVHPARRRRGVGRALMAALEARARELGLYEMQLDTATNQPEAVAFYRALGYTEVGQETRPEWSWTLVYFRKPLT